MIAAPEKARHYRHCAVIQGRSSRSPEAPSSAVYCRMQCGGLAKEGDIEPQQNTTHDGGPILSKVGDPFLAVGPRAGLACPGGIVRGNEDWRLL